LQPEIRRSVKRSGAYVIRFTELNEETETFEFLLEDTFFAMFESNTWENGKVKASVLAGKRPDGINLDIRLEGRLIVACDRCLENFSLAVESSQQLFVKFGQEEKELDDNVLMISRDDNLLDLSAVFYDYLVLAIPVQKFHPENEKGELTCDQEMIKMLDKHILSEEKTETDPRWDDLKKLLDKN